MNFELNKNMELATMNQINAALAIMMSQTTTNMVSSNILDDKHYARNYEFAQAKTDKDSLVLLKIANLDTIMSMTS